MLFIRTEDLKAGMRLAKPIYNKKGVLLYDRDSKLTAQGIESVRNFHIIGLYILEPAEPVPPMSEEDMEFERFQTMAVFSIKEELENLRLTGKTLKMQAIAGDIIKRYGRMNHRVNFVQDLRSVEDAVYRHSLNVSILCALIAHTMNLKLDEQQDLVIAALVHDIGKLTVPDVIREKRGELSQEEKQTVKKCEWNGFAMLERAFTASPGVRRIGMQANRELDAFERGRQSGEQKLMLGARILMVAEVFDTMTAMNSLSEPHSEVAALHYLLDYPEIFDRRVVDALVHSINILGPGCCVEMTNGEKGLVLVENEHDVLKPVILCFKDNSIIDLGWELVYEDLAIKDIMKTMDNRVVMDRSLLNQYGGRDGRESRNVHD